VRSSLRHVVVGGAVAILLLVQAVMAEGATTHERTDGEPGRVGRPENRAVTQGPRRNVAEEALTRGSVAIGALHPAGLVPAAVLAEPPGLYLRGVTDTTTGPTSAARSTLSTAPFSWPYRSFLVLVHPRDHACGFVPSATGCPRPPVRPRPMATGLSDHPAPASAGVLLLGLLASPTTAAFSTVIVGCGIFAV